MKAMGKAVRAALMLAIAVTACPALAVEPFWATDECTCALDPGVPKPYPEPPLSPLYVRFEGLMLSRQVLNGVPTNVPTNIQALAGNLDQPFEGGATALVGCRLGDSPLSVEASFLSVAQWDTAVTVSGVDFDGLAGPGNLFPGFIGNGQVHEISSLQTAELNLRRDLPMPPGRLTCSGLIGVRYMRIQEQFDYSDQSTLPLPLVSTRTTNDMWGPQIGGLFKFYIEDCWWIDFEMKGAVLANSASANTAFTADPTPVAPLPAATAGVTTYMGDFNLTLTYRWTPHIFGHVGYQAIFLDGLALARRNFDTALADQPVGAAAVEHQGCSAYHGAHAGLEVTW
jgi:hypothetical protein